MAVFQKIFAYNTGSTISGTIQVGDIAVSDSDVEYSANFGGLQWWGGPDETVGYVIAHTDPTGSHNGQPGIPAYLGFWRSSGLTDSDFLNLCNSIPPRIGFSPFTNTNDAYAWLNSNGYWTSFIPVTLTPTPTNNVTSTVTPTPTETPTNTPTPTVTNTSTETPTPTTTVTPTNTITETPTNTPTPSVTNTQTPTITPTVTPTNPTLLQILNQTTGDRTVTSFTLDGVTQPLSSGSYPVTAGNNGYALTHGTSSTPNGVIFNFGGSGTFDLYSYLNGNLVNYLASYNNSSYTMGGVFLQTSDQVLLRITDSGALPTPTQTSTSTPTPSVTNTQTPSVTPTLTPTTTSTPTPTPTSGATAPFSVSFVESGSNILMSYSGTLDLTGLDFVQNLNPGSGGVGASQGAFGIGPSGVPNVSLYTGATFSYPSNFGTGGGGPSSVTGTGDYFGVFSGLYPTNTLVVPTGYTSGNFIQGTTTLAGSSFTSLGINTGNYNYSWGAGAGQSFVLTIGGAGVTPTPTATSVTPTPTPTSGYTGDGWLFYAPEGPVSVGPPDNNGNSIFLIQSTTTVTYNPNYTGATLNIFFNSGTTLGTSYLTQFQNLDANGGTLTASQGSNTVIYSGNSSEYVVSPTGFLQLTLNRTAQMVQSASTPFVSGTTINVVVS
jgi:hypothetical protein